MDRIEVLKRHYEPRIEKYTDHSKILDWENRDAQFLRFKAFTDNIDLSGRSLLDVGCGCGDLFALVNELGPDTAYTGVDILEKMVDRAVSENPGGNFVYADIFADNFSAADIFGQTVFDITYTSGIFNLNAGNNEEFLKKAVPVLASLSEYAFVFNLLNPASPDRDDNYFYYDPESAALLAEPYADRIEMVNGYLSNDYTLICYRNGG